MASKKVLVVDDEIHIVHVVAIKLRNNGYEVVMAGNGAEAFEIAREEKPDILITHHPLQDGGLLTTHPIVGQIVLLGYEAAGARWTRDESLPPHQVSQVFFVGTVNGKPWSLCHLYHPEWSIYVDIKDVVDRKVKALDHLVSQHYEGKYARKRAESVDGWKGTRVDVPYAETFVPMIPEVHRYLPIMQSTLDTKKGWTARMKRLAEMSPYSRLTRRLLKAWQVKKSRSEKKQSPILNSVKCLKPMGKT